MGFRNISIKWKIITIATLGPLLIAVIFAFVMVWDIRKSELHSMVEKSRAIILMAEAGRSEMADKLARGVIRPFEDIEKENLIEAVPVITAIDMVSVNAESAGYRFRVPKISPRNPDNEPTEFEKKILSELKRGNLEEKVVVEKDRLHYFRPIRLTKECLICHGDPAGEKDPVGGTKEGWKTGEIHGAFELIMSLEETKKHIHEAELYVLLLALGTLSIICVISWLIIRASLLRPLASTGNFIKDIETGDLSSTIEVDRSDEMGMMMERLNTMVTRLKTMMKDITESGGDLVTSSHHLESISDALSSSSENTANHSSTVAAASEEMSVNMNSVAAAVEETATNVSLVAGAAEQMMSTIGEIVESTENARKITDEAVEQAATASTKVNDLGVAANEIGKVTEVITDISEQTNLLALNATIEAARAGEAGKGFAVVANEIKELARQTYEATDQIKQKTEGIQNSTDITVSQIHQISQIVNKVNDIVESIASAIEEQSRTTREIAENVMQASEGTREVTENVAQASSAASEIAREISEVNMEAGEISTRSTDVNTSARDLKEMAEKLKQLVSIFKV